MSESIPPVSDAKLLELLERAFAHHAGKDATIDRNDLQKALGLRSEYLAGRVLQCFDQNGDGVINREEFLAGVRTLVFGTDAAKLAFAFKLHDHDGDGAIDRDDMLRMIAISLAESEIRDRISQGPDELTSALFAAADTNGDQRISFAEFEAAIRTRPALLRKMTCNEVIWIAPNEDLLHWFEEKRSGKKSAATETNLSAVVFVVLFALVNAAIFAVWMRNDRAGGAALQMGRALAKCIDFDGALILVPMMRRLLTRVRPTWIGKIVPIDASVDFHRIVGHTLFALCAAHGAAIAASYASGHGRPQLFHLFLASRGLTGGILLVVFVVMWLAALAFVRRTSKFELFYFTHLLYVPWFVLAVVHAPSFALWAGVPILGFAVEQILRLFRRGPASAVVSSQALRSGVTRLEIARPPKFRFGPGDYAFLRVPAVARHEWHPFTISSAPERDSLTFHVRSLGNWTTALRARVEAQPDAPGLMAYVDGPYGSPTAHIFASRFAVLIGAGIGVTPFAAVLESVVLREGGASLHAPTLEKMHFFWVNRDQYSFEWFVALLHELEQADAKGILDVHLCMTGGRGGATAMGLELAREIMHDEGQKDIVTGLRTHTHIGAPDWNGWLRAIAEEHAPERVDVFFCGPPALGKKIKVLCARLKMSFREERF